MKNNKAVKKVISPAAISRTVQALVITEAIVSGNDRATGA